VLLAGKLNRREWGWRRRHRSDAKQKNKNQSVLREMKKEKAKVKLTSVFKQNSPTLFIGLKGSTLPATASAGRQKKGAAAAQCRKVGP
jgi:hypothetical protein